MRQIVSKYFLIYFRINIFNLRNRKINPPDFSLEEFSDYNIIKLVILLIMYKQNLMPEYPKVEIQTAAIWTIPKSGTTAIGHFFNQYGLRLSAENKEKLFSKKMFPISHSECPGFNTKNNDPLMVKKWQALKYAKTIGWNLLHPTWMEIDKHIKLSDHAALHSCKIVFLFRNPLDQLISHYKHAKNYPEDKYLGKIENAFADLEKFIFEQHALDAYLKMFYSYHVVRQRFPELFLFITYETFTQDRASTIRTIISHLGFPYEEEAFLDALEATSIQKLKKIEQFNNSSLLGVKRNDDLPATHIRNGGIGIWQDIMTPEMVRRIEAKFNEFGLSLNMFHLADDLRPEFEFLHKKNNAAKLRCRL